MTTLPADWTDEVQAYADSVNFRLHGLGVRRVCGDAFAYTVIKLRDLGLTEEPITRVCTPLLSMNTEGDAEIWRVARSIVNIAQTVKQEALDKASTIAAVMERYAERLPVADA